MKEILRILQRESLWPLLVALLATIVILPGIWDYGFWEPHEIDIADHARERLEEGGDEEAEAPATPRERQRQARQARAAEGPDLTETAVALGIGLFGPSEFGARLPLALLGLLAVVAIFLLGRRLGGPRAGLLSALVAVTFPLLVFQSRQLMSDIGAVTGSTLIMLGAVGLIWPSPESRATMLSKWLSKRVQWWTTSSFDVLLVVIGARLAYESSAMLVGWVVPAGAVALACLGGLFALERPPPAGDDDDEETRRARDEARDAYRVNRLRLIVAAGVTSALALGLLAYVLHEVFHITGPIPGERALFGHGVMPENGYIDAIGGEWKNRGNLESNFDALFEQLAFGCFPWIVLAPVALARLALTPRGGRAAWAGYLVFAWAAVAWVVCTAVTRSVGPVLYPALGAIAIACGLWLDELFAAREHAAAGGEDDGADRRLPPRTPLVALFVLLGAVVIGKDVVAFPDHLTTLHSLDARIAYPKDLALKKGVLVFGVGFGLAAFAGLLLWRRVRSNGSGWRKWRGRVYLASRYGVHGALAIAVLFAVFLAQVWTPTLSRKLSSKHTFAVYREHRAPGDELVIMGNVGSGPDYYADGEYTQLGNRKELLAKLGEDQRVWALTPKSELCAVHRAAKGAFDYHVLDNSHARFLLLSNRLKSGERDKNPLTRAILRERPADVGTPLSVNFDNRVRLIGVKMPASVDRGDSFQMTLFFEVLKPVGGSWKIFAHFDGGGMRFQGDHEPIDGQCATSYWQKGDYIVDTFTVEAGDVTYAKTTYTAYVGFFYGSHGNWKNMPITEGPKDNNDRTAVGRINVH